MTDTVRAKVLIRARACGTVELDDDDIARLVGYHTRHATMGSRYRDAWNRIVTGVRNANAKNGPVDALRVLLEATVEEDYWNAEGYCDTFDDVESEIKMVLTDERIARGLLVKLVGEPTSLEIAAAMLGVSLPPPPPQTSLWAV